MLPRILALVFTFSLVAFAADIPAPTDAQLHTALRQAKPGDHIRLGAGPYKGGFYAANLTGTKDHPIRISGPSPTQPAVIASETIGLQLGGASYIEIENLHVTKAVGNALAFDDGGKLDFSSHHLTIRHVRIENVGPAGTACSIKMAGVSDFAISDCTFQRWGEGGVAINGVGCKNGTVDRCTFLPGRGAVAIQFKGGSDAITIRHCLFDDAAPRGINVGGSTGLSYFRPKPMGFEARNITILGNTFIGGDAPICFPNTDGVEVRFNTIYLPRKWAFRILQETNLPEFTPSRNGRIEDNIIVFQSTAWFEGGINVGPHTAPQTFTFARNAWYCVDNPSKSAPRLPSAETDPLIGRDPEFTDPAKHDFTLRSTSPAVGKGQTAFKPEQSR